MAGLILLVGISPQGFAQDRLNLESLPDGDYRYRDSFALDKPYREVQFRKQNRYITGSDFDRRSGRRFCFRGMALANNVTHVIVATKVEQKANPPEKPAWQFQPGNSLNFNRLYPLQENPTSDLYQCLTPFLPRFNPQ